MASSESEVDLDKVLEAAHRIAQYIKKTPVMTCSTLDSMAGRTLHFKCELFQKTGAFKVSLREQGCRIGVSTHLQQSKQCGPHSNPGVDALYWFSPLLRGFFSFQILQFSPLPARTNTSKFQFDLHLTDTFKRVRKNAYVFRGQTNYKQLHLDCTGTCGPGTDIRY